MQCQESRNILDAYLDGEIELMRSVELEDHLATCAECGQDLESRRALQALTRNPNLRYAAPADLKKNIRNSLRLPEDDASQREAGSWWRWMFSPAVRWSVAAAMCVVLAGALVFWFRGQEQQKLAEQVVDNHIRSLMASHLADVPSSDQHTVKPWFAGKVTFSPNVTDFTDKGFILKGGRLDYMDNQSVAALVYQRRGHIINVFIYPSSENLRPRSEQLRGYNLIRWAGSGMEYWVVSDLNASELQELAGLLRG